MPQAYKFIIPEPNGIKLFIRLSPKAKREGIEGVYPEPDGKERLKFAVNAPPVDGRANQELIKQLSKLLHIAKSSITLIAGATDRNKTLFIEGDTQKITTLIVAEVSK